MNELTMQELIRRQKELRSFAQVLASVPFQARNHGLLFRTEAEAEEIEREIRYRRAPLPVSPRSSEDGA